MKPSSLLPLSLFLITYVNSYCQVTLWGTTPQGGSQDEGVIFKTTSSDPGITSIFEFEKTEGIDPSLNLCETPGQLFYGTTIHGGENDQGVLFVFDEKDHSYQVLVHFDASTGTHPRGGLYLSSDGLLYGMTSAGGSNDLGTLYAFDPETKTLEVLIDFDGTQKGASPYGSLVESYNHLLYGMTTLGGEHDLGVIFSWNISNQTFNILHHFDGNGSHPHGDLIIASDGNLYGLTKEGGTYDQGVLFGFDLLQHEYAVHYEFGADGNGGNPLGSLFELRKSKLYGNYLYHDAVTKQSTAHIFEYDIINAQFNYKREFSSGYYFLDPYNFRFTEGPNKTLIAPQRSHILIYNPASGSFDQYDLSGYLLNSSQQITVGSNGHYYGFSNYGEGPQVLFALDPTNGEHEEKLAFNAFNMGATPTGGLTQAIRSNGRYYGLTQSGGIYDKGTLYEVDPLTDLVTKMVDFHDSIGETPVGRMVEAANGKLYGATQKGGRINGSSSEFGTLFEFDPVTGEHKVIHHFYDYTGYTPTGQLLIAEDGNIYGNTSAGTSNYAGTIFRLSLTDNSVVPLVTLPQYTKITGGFVDLGGNQLLAVAYESEYDFQTHFKRLNLTDNTYQTLLKVSFFTEGSEPYGRPVLASNGKLYGFMSKGIGNDPDAYPLGQLYEFDLDANTYTIKHSFAAGEAKNPQGELIEASNGKLYGLAHEGGSNNLGSIIEYDINTDQVTNQWDFEGDNGKLPTISRLLETNGCHSYENLEVETCGTYTSPGGQEWAVSGNYTDQVDDGSGCITFYSISLSISNLVGDLNCNNSYDSDEFAGDIDRDGIILSPEIAGDLSGNQAINNDEIAGDKNGNQIIDQEEIAGDINGDGVIDGIEICGDINANGVIDGDELSGDKNGDGEIGLNEIDGDENGNGIIDGEEEIGDNLSPNTWVFIGTSTKQQLYSYSVSEFTTDNFVTLNLEFVSNLPNLDLGDIQFLIQFELNGFIYFDSIHVQGSQWVNRDLFLSKTYDLVEINQDFTVDISLRNQYGQEYLLHTYTEYYETDDPNDPGDPEDPVLGAEDIRDDQPILYPNPFSETIHIQNLPLNEKQSVFTIHGLDGKIIYSGHVESTDLLELNIPGSIPAGNYMLKIDDGKNRYGFKILKR